MQLNTEGNEKPAHMGADMDNASRAKWSVSEPQAERVKDKQVWYMKCTSMMKAEELNDM